MWPCYEMFSNTDIATSVNGIGQNSHYQGHINAKKLSYDLKTVSSVGSVTGSLSKKLSLHPESVTPAKMAKLINIFFILLTRLKGDL